MLGLRLVKLTVNFDDPGTYHFYFGNERGTPGSILTFFPWAGLRPGTVGNGQVSATTFAVPTGAIEYWRIDSRPAARRTKTRAAVSENRCSGLADPDGLPLELIASEHTRSDDAWKGSSRADRQGDLRIS